MDRAWFEVDTDQDVAVVLHRFPEVVLVHLGHLEYWGNSGYYLEVFLDNFAVLCPGGPVVKASNQVGNQNHYFQRPHLQLILLIPKSSNF